MKSESWAHIDIAGVMDCNGELPFLEKGMSGIYVVYVHFSNIFLYIIVA